MFNITLKQVKLSMFRFVLSGLLSVVCLNSNAQVDLTASAGTLTATYPTLGAAILAVNAGTHQGTIDIAISANTTETGPSVLNSSGAGAASYSSLKIFPSVNNVTISGPTTTGRGLIELKGADNVTIDGDNPNTVGINRNLTITNTAANTITYTSVIRIANATTVVTTSDNNTIKNCILNGSATGRNIAAATSTTGSENTTFCIFAGGNGGSSATDAPTPVTNVTTTVIPSGTSVNNVIIENNSFNSAARGINLIGATTTSLNGVTITNNLIGDQSVNASAYPYTSVTSTIYARGIFVIGANNLSITGNSIKNIYSYLGSTTSGIELNATIGAGLILIANNILDGVVVNTAGGGARGINVSAANSAYSITNNSIFRIESTSARGIGIYVSTSATSGLINRNKIERIRTFSTSTLGAYGMQLNGGNNITVQNNFISDVNQDLTVGGSFSITFGAFGLNINGGTGHKILHNSINLSGSTLGGSGSGLLTAALSINTNTLTGLEVQNNILSNTMLGGTNNIAHVALSLPSGATSAMNLMLNNNAYYSGTDAARQGIAQVGTTAGTGFYLASNFVASTTAGATNLRSYTSILNSALTNDNSSLASSALAPFVSASDLHLNTALTPTQLESGGAVTTTTVDIDGDARPGPVGSVNGGANAPDIGADEFDGVPLDLIAPVITFTPLIGTCITGARTITATITDASGVPTSGIGLPVLYWRINSGIYNSAQGTLSGTNQYSFTFGSGAVSGDVVSYYIVAQDNASTPNIRVNPSAGASGLSANPPAAATPPTTPTSYLLQNTLAGTYTVGGSGNYTTLTAAVNAYNTSCLSGPVVFELTDALYSTAETFPIQIIGNPDASATNTLTIRPASGVSTTLTGSSASSIIKYNGADYVSINGSNNNTTSRDLTIINTNVGTSSLVIWIASESVTNPSSFCGISNTNVTGSGPLATFAGIFAGSGTAVGSAAQFTQTNIIIVNNQITKSQYGIGNAGSATANVGNIISNNIIGSIIPSDYIGFVGIFASNQNGIIITNNIIKNIITSANNPVGMNIAANVTNSTISSNNIDNIRYTGNAGYGGKGLNINTGSATSNLTVMNNMISNIGGDGWNSLSGGDAVVGIRVLGTTGGLNILNNTINLGTGSFNGNASGTVSAALYFASTVSNIDLRNNILTSSIINSNAAAAKTYAIYSDAINTAFSNINHNNYSVNGPQGVIGFIGSPRLDLAAIQAGFGSNLNSVNIAPVFVSSTDLHLLPLNNPTLLDLAQVIATVTSDIDGQPRGLTPDMGADEFGDLPLTPPTPTQSATTPNCTTGTDLSVAGTPATNVMWYWQTTANGTSLSTPVSGPYTVFVNGTYYVRAYNTDYMAWSMNSSSITISNIPLAPVPPTPVAAMSPACGMTDISVPASVDPNITYYWQGMNATGIDNSQAANSPLTVSSTGTYYVAAFDMSTNCWSNTAGVMVTINPIPTGLTATATQSTICNGASIDLMSSSMSNSTVVPVTVLTQDFESGLGTWSIVNGGSSPVVANWSVKNAPYTYSTYFTNYAMQGNNFAMSVSDAGGFGSTTNSQLVSPSFSTLNMTSADLTFKNLLRYSSDQALVEISINGGTSWNNLKTYTSSQGTTTSNAQVAFSESIVIPAAYLNQANVQIRFNYISNWGYFWGVDGIQIAGQQVSPSTYSWTSNPVGFTSTDQNPLNVMPTVTTNYTVTATNSFSCTASQSVNVVVNQPTTNTINATACTSYTLNGNTYTTSGTHVQTLTNAAGCDSTITLNLIINNTSSSSVSPIVCSTYTAPSGTVYTSSGIYTDVIMNSVGCDSTITINLTVNSPSSSSISASICGGTYTAPSGATYSTAGTYTDIIPNSVGCDSTITITLIMGTINGSSITATSCDSYTSQSGVNYTTSGVYTEVFTNVTGCDSTVTFNLTINNSSSSSISPVVCSTYTSPSGIVYNSSAVFTDIIPNSIGCDSTITINLTVNTPTSASITENICGGVYTAPSGAVYTTSGVYTDIIQNAAGCDSTITITLNVGAHNSSTQTIVNCGPYTNAAGTTFSSSGNYTYVLTNASGCDSTVNLTLTVNNVSTNSISPTICGSSYVANGITYTMSGTYTQTLSNSVGCDSLLTINLTLNSLPVVNTTLTGGVNITATGGDTYQWINCTDNTPILGATNSTFTATANGSYAVIATSTDGCSTTSNCVAITTVGIKETIEFNLMIAPNPVSDVVRINFDFGGSVNIKMYDAQGKLVMTTENYNSGSEISMISLEPGVYYFSINNGSETIVRRVIKD